MAPALKGCRCDGTGGPSVLKSLVAATFFFLFFFFCRFKRALPKKYRLTKNYMRKSSLTLGVLFVHEVILHLIYLLTHLI